MTKQSKTKVISIKYFIHDFVKIVAGIPGLIWHRPKLIYENEAAKERIKGGAILISNHLGFFDPIYLQYAVWYRRHHFICLQKFIDSKVGWLFKAFLCIPIDKENFKLDSFHIIVDHLLNGELVSMFPEGKVNDGSGEMAEFKSGVILMALKSKSPIIPIYIKEKEHWYERVTMVIGERITIDIRQMSFNSIDNTAKLLKDKEEQLKRMVVKK